MKIIVAIILLSCLPFNSFASCANKEEANALDFTAIQSSMMVAALSCNQQSQYNKFIKKYKKEVSNGGVQIKSYFKRTYGNKYESKLNNFMTKLANKATKSSMVSDSDTYCEESSAALNNLLSIKDNQISKFKHRKQYSSIHGVSACS
jgi:hypothetical protein